MDTRTAVWVSTPEKLSKTVLGKLGIFLESLGGPQRQLWIKTRPLFCRDKFSVIPILGASCSNILLLGTVRPSQTLHTEKIMQRIIFSTGYNYDYKNNCRETFFFACAYGKRINYNYINNCFEDYLCNARLQLQLHESFPCELFT